MPITVLAVDDSDIIRGIVAANLEASGFVVTLAEDGVEALAKALSLTPDIIITDIRMPNKDGITLIRELRNISKFADVPILVMSSEQGEKVRELARASGATDWISKLACNEGLVSLVQKYSGV